MSFAKRLSGTCYSSAFRRRRKNERLGVKRGNEKFIQSANFGELIKKAYETKLQMQKDGLFNRVVVLVDVDRSDAPSNQGYEVTFVTGEPKLSKLFMGVEASNRGEGSLAMNFNTQNTLGAGETFVASASQGNEQSLGFHFGFQKPLIRWRDAKIGLNLFRAFTDYPWSKYASVENAVGVEFQHEPFRHLTHQLRYLVDWRRVDVYRAAPFSIREHAGHSLKSSLQNSLIYDTQDDSLLATRGIFLRLSTEIAGLGGDAKFDRHDATLKLTTTLPLGIILAVSGQLAYVKPRGGPRLHVMDRTFLGGAVNLRGFDYNGIGPSEDRCTLGGSASWTAAAHIYRRLFPHFVFAHGFAAFGSVEACGRDRPFADIFKSMTSEPRFSVGAGLAVKVGQLARLEFNYCVPFSSHAGDRFRPGFQFGVGVNFI